MLSVKGTFQDGVVRPLQPVTASEGQQVIITFLEDGLPASLDASREYEAAWDDLDRLIEGCTIHTGIGDLAHQHDHYLYGKPKAE